ncbi:MAG: hypothetical protein ACM30E_05180 [Nitrososphaerales archaeon]
MEIHDDDPSRFAAEGAAPLLVTEEGYVFASLQRPEQFNAAMLRVLETFKALQIGC